MSRAFVSLTVFVHQRSDSGAPSRTESLLSRRDLKLTKSFLGHREFQCSIKIFRIERQFEVTAGLSIDDFLPEDQLKTPVVEEDDTSDDLSNELVEERKLSSLEEFLMFHSGGDSYFPDQLFGVDVNAAFSDYQKRQQQLALKQAASESTEEETEDQEDEVDLEDYLRSSDEDGYFPDGLAVPSIEDLID